MSVRTLLNVIRARWEKGALIVHEKREKKIWKRTFSTPQSPNKDYTMAQDSFMQRVIDVNKFLRRELREALSTPR